MSALISLYCAPHRPELLDVLQQYPQSNVPTRILKRDRGTTVTLVSLPTGAIVIKHHRFRNWRRRGDTLVHGSPARRAWQGAQLLQAAGIAVPRPLAAVEKRTAHLVQESFYVSEALLTHLPLNTYWQEARVHWPRQQRLLLLRALALFVRRLHEAGLYVGDLKDENLFVEEQPLTQWTFYLVDLDRVAHYEPLSLQRRLKNLVQLERTLGRQARATERLFFFYQYLGTPLPPRPERQQILTQLLRLRSRKEREYARRRVRHAQSQEGRLGTSSLAPTQHVLDLQADRPPITCCIICFNEETNIRRCLESVKWCDEIIIVDSFSTDRTVAICREYTSHIIQRPWPGYVEQKRFALAQATHEWVLNVDADEELSPELRLEILTVLQRNHPAVDGFYVPRLVYYLGRWWWRGWYPGYRLRLFRKAKVRWGGVNPHEKVLLRGQADFLQGCLYHYTYDNISDHLRTLNGLTDVAAQELALRKKPFRFIDLLLRPAWRFFRFYVVSGVFRDGIPGLFTAVTSAFYVFLKYAKLWEYNSLQSFHASPQDPPYRPREELGRRRSASLRADLVSASSRTSINRRG